MKRTCKNCGGEFKTLLAYIRRGEKRGVSEGQFCSQACYMEARKKKTPKAVFNCEWCGKRVEMRKSDYDYKSKHATTPQFCSLSCRSSVPTVGSRILRGYRYIHAPWHPHANSSKQVAEHRLVMEKKIGRYLKREELVHHINHNKLDNSPDNLMLVDQKQHEAVELEHKRQKMQEWWTPERRAWRGKLSREMWAARKEV